MAPPFCSVLVFEPTFGVAAGLSERCSGEPTQPRIHLGFSISLRSGRIRRMHAIKSMPDRSSAWRSILVQARCLTAPSIPWRSPPPLSPLSPHVLWHNGITPSAIAPALWRKKLHYCGLYNICIPTDSSVGDGGRGDGRRWQCSAALGEKKKSNLQFAPEVRLTDQVRTSIR